MLGVRAGELVFVVGERELLKYQPVAPALATVRSGRGASSLNGGSCPFMHRRRRE